MNLDIKLENFLEYKELDFNFLENYKKFNTQPVPKSKYSPVDVIKDSLFVNTNHEIEVKGTKLSLIIGLYNDFGKLENNISTMTYEDLNATMKESDMIKYYIPLSSNYGDYYYHIPRKINGQTFSQTYTMRRYLSDKMESNFKNIFDSINSEIVLNLSLYLKIYEFAIQDRRKAKGIYENGLSLHLRISFIYAFYIESEQLNRFDFGDLLLLNKLKRI